MAAPLTKSPVCLISVFFSGTTREYGRYGWCGMGIGQVRMMVQDKQMTSVTVIIPTLNEEDNIDLLLERVLAVRSHCGLDFDILFVDSASADQTCGKILRWQDRGPVRLLRRDTNVGLAGAVLAGARFVSSDIVLVMDADLSHPPEAIPVLLQPLLAKTHDMVVGSRYAPGGATPDWPWTRKFSSRLATLPALLFCDIRDPLAGFFAVRRELLSRLPAEVPGFKIGLAILAEYGGGLRVQEFPIEFRDRDYGKSKMNHAVAFDYLRQLLSLFRRHLRRRLAS
jgi:dolichol-phosphate mannosyltransferase